MRIAWFTPYNSKTAITKYSKVVLSELHKSMDVCLFLPDEAQLDSKSTVEFPIVQYSNATLLTDLSNYDFAVFNMGDSAYHLEVWEALKLANAALYPCVVILHDWYNLDFFASYYHFNNQPKGCFDLIEHTYGTRVLSDILREWNNPEAFTTRIKYPLFEPIIELADAVIVHSQFCADKISSGFSGMIQKLFVPNLNNSQGVGQLKLLSKNELGLPLDAKIFLSYGNCVPHKCVDKTIKVLGILKNKISPFMFCIVGRIDAEYRKKILTIAQQAGVEHCIKIHDYATVDEAHSYLTHADVCINLRNPCLEGASAAIVDYLSYGKACIVSNHGSYSELPDDVVVKIDPTREIEELVKYLPKLLNDSLYKEKFANNAKTYFHENLSVHKYAEQFIKFTKSFEKRVNKLQRTVAAASYYRKELINLGLMDKNHFSDLIISELTSLGETL